MDIADRLRDARTASGEELPVLGKRIGVRQEHLRAIEEGRFADLPAGIYGRAAVKSFATAVGIDPAEALAACEALLSPMDEPIAALARLRGVRSPARTAVQVETAADASRDISFPGWRSLVAAAVDAVVVVGLLLLVVVAAMTALTVPVSALKDSAPPFALMGALLGAGYFLCFGGVRGATIGERALGVEPRVPSSSTVTLRVVAERALMAATEDARSIQRIGEWLGRSVGAWASSAVSDATDAVKG